ncbi:MAG: ABC transporter permease subunit, partial [Deltaproteobacteria bacterium]|nr:ABC transporter permease subunit [Deltaproteobacteria bacterium]
FVAFFGPLIGLLLGFDAINRERTSGTLSKIVSQPIYRDSIINGKFLAGVFTISIMLISIVLLVSGLGLLLIGVVPGIEEILRIIIYLIISIFYISFWLVGVVPGIEEILRIIIYLIISIFYISFWLGVAILFSVLFRSVATSALAALALWIFFSFFVSLGANVLANAVAPIEKDRATVEMIEKHVKIQRAISLFSPMVLYRDATTTIIDPTRRTTKSLLFITPMEKLSLERFKSPLSLLQSLLVVIPQVTILIAITLICFGITYTVFMLQEIRSM